MAFGTTFKKRTNAFSTLPLVFESTEGEGDGLLFVGKHLITGLPVKVGYYQSNMPGLANRKPLKDMVDKLKPGAVVVFQNAYPQESGIHLARWAKKFVGDKAMGKVVHRQVSIVAGVRRAKDKAETPWMRADVIKDVRQHIIIPGDAQGLDKLLQRNGLDHKTFPPNVASQKGLEAFMATLQTKLSAAIPSYEFAIIRLWDDKGDFFQHRVNVKRERDSDLKTPVLDAIKNLKSTAFYQFIEAEKANIAAYEIIPGISFFAGPMTTKGLRESDFASIATNFPVTAETDAEIPSYRSAYLAIQEVDSSNKRYDSPFFNGQYAVAINDEVVPPAYPENAIPSALFAGRQLPTQEKKMTHQAQPPAEPEQPSAMASMDV